MQEGTHRGIEIEMVTGAAITAWLETLAELRIRVFRDFPYLYDGTVAYETAYLKPYARSPGGVIVLARDGEAVVGASTGMPLADETENIQKPFVDAGIPLDQVFYFGESVLLPSYRGRGIGHAFFDRREAWAATLPGITQTAFCAVVRPDDHPARPASYRPLDGFWRARGYQVRSELVCEMTWRDVGEQTETSKPLRFWTRHLKS